MAVGQPKKDNSPKDAEIIAQNPTLTPYQLLTEKGLSSEMFEQLVNQQDQTALAKANSKPIDEHKRQSVIKAQPIISGALYGSVWVLNKSTGISMKYARKIAERMISQHPNDYAYA